MGRRVVIIFVIFAVLLYTGASASVVPEPVRAAPSAAVTPTICTLPGAPIKRSAPAVGDLDHDGVKEIVVAGSDGWVYALHPDCSAVPGWPKQVNNYFTPPLVANQSTVEDIESTPALADLNGDGWLEVILTVGWMPQYHHNGGVIVFNHDGTVKPGWPRVTLDTNGAGDPPWNPDGFTDGVFSTPAIGDVDGDGQPEIVFGSFDKCIYVWHANGTPAAGWWDTVNNRPARCLADTIWSSPALADLDGDGVSDIIIGTDANRLNAGGSVWAFKGNNTKLWRVDTTQIIQSSPAVGDINGDGYPEIVVGTGTYYPQGYQGYSDGHKVYAFDRFGNNLPGWPQATNDNMYASPSLADLNGDGKLEVLIGSGPEIGGVASAAKLYVWRYDGTALPGYPVAITRANPWPAGQSTSDMPYVPIVADYNNDGVQDVFLVEDGAWGISVFPYNNPGAVDPYKYTSNNTLQAAPVIDNLYNDGRLYMIAGGADSSGSHAVVYIWQISNTSSGARPWPMARRDSLRNGSYPRLAALAASPLPMYVLHQVGTGSSEQISLYIQNIGDGSFTWTITSKPANVTLSAMSGTSNQVVIVTISTAGKGAGTYSLGNIVITATAPGGSVANSPLTVPLSLYVGNVYRQYLPAIIK